MELGKRIKLFRNLKNKTQEEMAEDLHITGKTLSSYERDYTEPSVEILKAMAKYFGITVDELLGEENQSFLQDDFLFALYGETKDLSSDEKQDILDIVKQAHKMLKK